MSIRQTYEREQKPEISLDSFASSAFKTAKSERMVRERGKTDRYIWSGMR